MPEIYDKKIEGKTAIEWMNIGFGLGCNEDEKAIECFNKALKLAPENDEIWNRKGFALFCLDRYEDAIKCFDKALELNPISKDQLNRFLTTNIDLEPELSRHLNALGSKSNSLKRIGREEEASRISEFVSAILFRLPEDFYHFMYKGLDLMSKEKNYQAAANYFRQVADLYPDHASPYIAQADCYWRLDKFEDALKLLDKAEILITSEKSKFYYAYKLDSLYSTRGGCYLQMGAEDDNDYDLWSSKGIIDCKIALKINPNNKLATELLEIEHKHSKNDTEYNEKIKNAIQDREYEINNQIKNLNKERSKKFNDAGNISYTKYQKNESNFINMIPELKGKLDAVIATDLLINKANQEIHALNFREKKSGFFAKLGDAVTSTAKIGKLKVDLYNFGKKKDNAITEFGEQLYIANKTGTLTLKELSNTWQRVDELKNQIDLKNQVISYIQELILDVNR